MPPLLELRDVSKAIGGLLILNRLSLAGHLVTLLVLAFRPTGLLARTRDA